MTEAKKLDPLKEGVAEGLSTAAKMTLEKPLPMGEEVSRSRMMRLFNTVGAPLDLPSSEYAMGRNPTLGKDRGNYAIVSEKVPTANGGTIQTVEIGSGLIFVDMKKQEYGVRPNPADSIIVGIERDANGASKLSATVRGQNIDGFDKIDQKDAGRMIGEMMGRVQLGQMVSVGDMAARITNEAFMARSASANPSEAKVGQFRTRDLQARLNAQGATTP